MGIKATFKMADIERELEKRARQIEAAIIRRLQFLGEKCLIECRTNKTYMDQTGNLTASMGYVITANGKIIEARGFSGGGSEGPGKGEALATEVAARFRSGYALIVVAGMNYAAAVEARGKNVLASAELLAEKELPRMLKALTRNIEKMNL